MPEYTHPIARKRGSDDPSSFENLRRQGIRFIQEASGRNWTDYNVHDPGVTILDQICYAITDLIYRTGFPLQDFLTGKDGIIDFEKQGLVPPQLIFPSHPTTLEDYRKVLLDSIPEIDNVWLQPHDESVYRGLYRISVRLSGDLPDPRRKEILERVKSVYLTQRNLCEDVEQVVALGEDECDLEARIESTGSRPPEDIAAEIYYRAGNQIAQTVHFEPFEAGLSGGLTPGELFTGPMTRHGIVRGGSHDRRVVQDPTPDLFPVITAIEGVGQIRHLTIRPIRARSVDEAPKGTGPETTTLLRLRLPASADEIRVTLVKNSRNLPLTAEGIQTRYDKLSFEQRSLRRAPRDLGPPEVSPPGRSRDMDRYSSIQNHFPAIYGLGEYGVPEGAGPETRARAMQLKAYLLLFDQMMANFTANLANFKQLMSPEVWPLETYRARPIESGPVAEGRVPGLDQIYSDSPSRIVEEVFVESYDRHKAADRKSRVLDYLLALYGEKFTQSSLRHYGFYRNVDDAEEVRIENKLRLFKSVVDVNRDRSAGAVTSGEGAGAGSVRVSGLERKVRILLGFESGGADSLTSAFRRRNLTLDDAGTDAGPEMTRLPTEQLDPTRRATMKPLPRRRSPARPGDVHRTEVPTFGAALFGGGRISGPVMRSLVFRHRYLIDSRGDEFVVVARVDDSVDTGGVERWIRLGACRTEFEAKSEADALRGFLIDLNTGSEGMHVVEHILLRPGAGTPPAGAAPDFYAFRISVMFPSWTARTSDAEFRKLAEETVRLNCPAHLSPQCYWLGWEQMTEFERLFSEWKEARGGRPADASRLEQSGAALIAFILGA